MVNQFDKGFSIFHLFGWYVALNSKKENTYHDRMLVKWKDISLSAKTIYSIVHDLS